MFNLTFSLRMIRLLWKFFETKNDDQGTAEAPQKLYTIVCQDVIKDSICKNTTVYEKILFMKICLLVHRKWFFRVAYICTIMTMK